ncbi:STAS domain-containing protein [Curvibacter sp. RS43]|uniref:STAS domain-containing protein n=1 Tax=Curvibacter microcysteis TaxID=3026419 RepID=UPI00235FA2F1|nr:STAS domain-containing protein [Curvibacter sp. RS43]MDD0812118.1 STAS domain-containing protein [Curvibacter sp. RS43]
MTKEDPSGLLSKVVRFVTSPTTNWGDLDQSEDDRDSNYNKQALKEMIERKRRNDFVRRREFDQLRKLRKREALNPPEDPQARPSFFQSSLASRTDDRAGTLKKIDEIEAQMSMQWWRSKQGQPPPGTSAALAAAHKNAFAPTRPTGLASAPASVPASVPAATQPQSCHSLDAAHTLPGSTVSTSMLKGMSIPASRPGAPAPPQLADWDFDGPGGRGQGPAFAPTAVQSTLPMSGHSDFASSRLLGQETPAYVHAPELEEAAIRYANGDVEGAESAVLDLVQQPSLAYQEPLWMALFDLYRATAQADRFDSASIDFAGRFGRSGPLWVSFPSADASARRAPTASPWDDGLTEAAGYQWTSPSVLGLQSVAALKAALGRAASPWLLDWSRLSLIEDAAVPPLAELMADWAQSRVRLRWQGMAIFDDVLRAQTRSGEPEVSPAWWQLRMESLRVMGRAEEFELVALDYCITYEQSPPSWQAPYCECRVLTGDGAGLLLDAPAGEGPATQPSRYHTEFATTALALDMPAPDSEMGGQQAIVVDLSGTITGDVGGSLPVPLPGYRIPKVLVVDCARLVRIDFSAAGSVLNWAAARQAEGTQVQFQQLHRLVAVFFNVIGINDHARVMPRQD